jgi:proton-translocating NADH-quinone oxidoreductase chain L
MSDALLLIPLLPLLAAIAIAVLGYPLLRQYSHWPCIIAAAASCYLSIYWLLANQGPPIAYYDWFAIGDVRVQFAFQADGLTLIMLSTVTFVGTLIAIYSAGYMRGDEGYPRYFAVFSLFLFAMTGLVLASNFILLYAFWEGVGVCSYLLIGFWFTRPAAAAAARKAFLVTRIGDAGLFLGILVIWAMFTRSATSETPLHSFDFDKIFLAARYQSPELLFAVCMLLFCGAVGKSAQFPLHVWLPDAMEGPSPVSALIHAATMVTAGVYLVARCTPLFGLAPGAQLVVAVIGGFTALLAALIALTQPDLKRVLAYSTVSQLGYMFLALGSGVKYGQEMALAPLAVTAAIFHLFTHAFFKALLFLGAGSVMHAMGGVIDMRRFGGLRRVLPVTHWTFLFGAAALAGVPLLSGFWSKDEILAATLEAADWEWSTRGVYAILLVVGIVTAGLTGFYTFRAYFLTFWGPERIPPEAGHHAHESPLIMTVPLIILAIGAAGVGIIFGNPVTHTFQDYLHDNWIKISFGGLMPATEEAHAISGVVALAGIGAAWWIYIKKPAAEEAFAKAYPGIYQLSRNRFYIDEIYNIFIIQPMSGLATFCRLFDLYLVDGLVDFVGESPRYLGNLFRPLQNGLVQFYALLMILGVAGFVIAVWLR